MRVTPILGGRRIWKMGGALLLIISMIIGGFLIVKDRSIPGASFVHQYVDGVSSKTVALTIDDGPDATYTPEVLDILHAHGARATFFVVGRRAQALPDLVHREIAEGHEIGNHTMTHVGWNDKSYDESLAEILEAQKAISSVTGSEPVFFRSPHGQNTKANAQAIVDSHLQAVRWTIGVEHHASGSAQAEADRVAAAVRPGTIILAHDGGLDRSETVEALSILLNKLDAQGYEVVPLGELLKEGQGLARTP